MPKPWRSSPVLRKPSVYVAVTLAFLCLIELVFLLINLERGEDRPFLIDWDPDPDWTAGTALTYVDPHLGATFNPGRLDGEGQSYQHGFFVHGRTMDGRALVIVTLGGSTTEGRAWDAWPRQLQGLLASQGIPAVVWNGGISGYGSRQELLKLLRDGLTLKPDIVISYDGVNDIWNTSSGDDLFMDPFLMRVFDQVVNGVPSRILPNTIAFLRRTLAAHGIEGIEHGIPYSASPAERWYRNIRSMKAIADGFGIRYLDFLQPALGVGSYRPSPEEIEAARKKLPNKDYDLFYPEARRIAAREDFIVDLTEVFAGHRGIFIDNCHVRPEGNFLVARAILDELRRRGWIPPPPRTSGQVIRERRCCADGFVVECLFEEP